MRILNPGVSILLIVILLAGCRTHSGSTTNQKALQIRPDETVLNKWPANLWRGKEAVGGELTITSQRLLFRPHGFNFQRAPEEIALTDIVEVMAVNYVHSIRPETGVLVRLRSGKDCRFVAGDRVRVIDSINAAVEQTQPSSRSASGMR